jgi:DNA topoisomerase VI subunit A
VGSAIKAVLEQAKAIKQLPEKTRLAITLYYYEKLTFKEVDADFIVAIETGGMFARLIENGFDSD